MRLPWLPLPVWSASSWRVPPEALRWPRSSWGRPLSASSSRIDTLLIPGSMRHADNCAGRICCGTSLKFQSAAAPQDRLGTNSSHKRKGCSVIGTGGTQDVEPTNNLAERTIRTYVIWRKTSFGTQSKRGSLYMERMMTVVGSCKLQGRNVLEFVTDALYARLGHAVTPSLLPACAGRG